MEDLEMEDLDVEVDEEMEEVEEMEDWHMEMMIWRGLR